MKIAFVIPDFRIGTPTHFYYVYELARAISLRGDVFLIIEKGDAPDFLPKNKFYLQKFQFLPFRIIENFLAVFYVRLRGYKDFYIHYSFLSALNASLAVRFLGGRTFYWNCGLPWLYKRSSLRELFERTVYKMITFLVTGTESLKKEYSIHYQIPYEKIRTMPNLVDIGRFSKSRAESASIRKELGIGDKTKVILFAHCLSRRKGAHYLPQIIRNFKGKDVVFLIAGSGQEQQYIEPEISKEGMRLQVRFLGWVPNMEIQRYFGAADIFILPSEEEGFPHVLLEAMAAEVPLVAFDVGGVKDIVPPTFLKYVVSKGDIMNFSKKAEEIFKLSFEEIYALKNVERDWMHKFDMSLASNLFSNLLLE